MITDTKLLIINNKKRVEVFTPEEVKNFSIKNRFICTLKNQLQKNNITFKL